MKPIVVIVLLLLVLIVTGFIVLGFANQENYELVYTDVSDSTYIVAGNPVYDFEKPIKKFGDFFNSIGDFFKDVFQLFDTEPKNYRFYKITYRFTLSSDPNNIRTFSILVYADADDPDGDDQFEHTYRMFRVYAYQGDITFLSFMNGHYYLFIRDVNNPYWYYADTRNLVNFEEKFVYQWLTSNAPPPNVDIRSEYSVVTFSGWTLERFVMNDFNSSWIFVGD